MGIEGGGREYSRSGRMIEGEPIERTHELDIDDVVHIPLPREISWTDGSVINFSKVGETYSIKYVRGGYSQPISLYTAILEYFDQTGNKVQVDLSRQTTKPCYLTGTSLGFYAHDPASRSQDENFIVIGIEPRSLEENQRKLLSLYHELGHAVIFDNGDDVSLFRAGLDKDAKLAPDRCGILLYAVLISRSMPDRVRDELESRDVNLQHVFQTMNYFPDVDQAVRLFHERYAWATGMWLAKILHLPTGFNKQKSQIEYAQYCLSSYANYYDDDSFSKGLVEIRRLLSNIKMKSRANSVSRSVRNSFSI